MENEFENNFEAKTIVENLSKDEVYDEIFKSYNYGNLGMFIGSGFSKAVCPGEALNWKELIYQTAYELDIEIPDEKDLIGVSFPELATRLCKKLMHNKSYDYFDATKEFKKKICDKTNWLPEDDVVKEYKKIFDTIDPSWLITTNYDLVLETILTGKCRMLTPNNYFSAEKGIIPIYHIHGTKKEWDSIIITQEDYIPLFRPNEYRQAKLAMTIRESTTLVIGYNLGDMNILTSLDWSKNIYSNKNDYPHSIIQAVYVEDSTKVNPEPYIDENRNIIIEYSDLEEFLNILCEEINIRKEEYNRKIEELDKIKEELNESRYEKNKFINDYEYREEILKLASDFEHYMIESFIDTLTYSINIVWNKARENGGFHYYKTFLIIIMDVIENYDYNNMPPMIFKKIAEGLNKVFPYIHDNPNTNVTTYSWSATKYWHKNKENIPKNLAIDLYNYAKDNRLYQLKCKLKEIKYIKDIEDSIYLV